MNDDIDITDSLAPKSDQLDNIELIVPRTFTIERLSRNNDDQPWNFHLRDFPRVWRPGVTMRRLIAAAWGTKASAYVGQSVTLYRDTTVSFGKDPTGGTRISHMTGIGDKPLKVTLPVSRGKVAQFVVQPLETATPKPQRDFLAELTLAGDDLDAVRALGNAAIAAKASPDVIQTIRDKSTALSTKPTMADDNEVF
jgi:hypothetical protein